MLCAVGKLICLKQKYEKVTAQKQTRHYHTLFSGSFSLLLPIATNPGGINEGTYLQRPYLSQYQSDSGCTFANQQSGRILHTTRSGITFHKMIHVVPSVYPTAIQHVCLGNWKFEQQQIYKPAPRFFRGCWGRTRRFLDSNTCPTISNIGVNSKLKLTNQYNTIRYQQP